MLVDPALTLRTGQGVDGADDDRFGGGPRSLRSAAVGVHATATRASERDHGERSFAARHRSTVIRVLAAAWVAAGTPHVPVAHRCQEKSSPAPRSTGNTASTVERHVDQREQERGSGDRDGNAPACSHP